MSLRHQRPLLPRPPQAPKDPNEGPSRSLSSSSLPSSRPPSRSPSSSSRSSAARKSFVACLACRAKKSKCDGERPACRACRCKSQRCVYETDAGLTRKEQMERTNSSLQENVESFAKLYQILRNNSTQEADDLFQRIRNGLSLEAALGYAKNQSRDAVNSASTAEVPSSPTHQWSQQIHDCNMLFEHQVLSTEVSDGAKQALRDGIARYFACLGTMFPVITREEVDSTMASFLAPRKEGTKDNQVLVEKQVAFGELLALCAVGFQYDRQTLPGGSTSLCTPFYQKARLFLDFVVENAPLRAMRICCCLGIYNVIAKSSLAVSYTDWGLVLAANEGLIGGKRSAQVFQNERIKYRRTLTALVTVRSWLTATLGHIPSPQVARCVHETEEQIEISGDSDGANSGLIDMIQQNMAKITVMKANILRAVSCFRNLSPAILQQMSDDLERWRSHLPDYIQLENLVSSPTISQDQRRVTFYMYLFYMSAIMLKARAVLAREANVAANLTTPASAEERRAISDGISAARNSRRLLGLIYDEGGVIKNCWLTIYQCYVTYLTLNYAALKGFLVGGGNKVHADDMALSGICVDILQLCATKDRLGGVFYQRLLKVSNTIKEHLDVSAHTRLSPADAGEAVTNGDSYLFVDVDGTTKLHQMIRSIRLMLCYPLNCLYESDNTNVLNLSMVDAYVNADIDFAHHLASPFNMDDDRVPDKLFPPSQLSRDNWANGEQGEGFLSGSAPFDWIESAWSGNNIGAREPSGTEVAHDALVSDKSHIDLH